MEKQTGKTKDKQTMIHSIFQTFMVLEKNS